MFGTATGTSGHSNTNHPQIRLPSAWFAARRGGMKAAFPLCLLGAASVLSIGATIPTEPTVPVAGVVALSPLATTRTKLVTEAATQFLAGFRPEERAKVQFAFEPGRAAVIAHFARSSPPPGLHAPSGPPPGAGGPPPGPHPGGPGGGPGNGPPGGFVGERYGQAVWSNYPVSDVPRPGLRMGALSPAQQAAALHLLQTVLSAAGYAKVQAIMGSDEALSEQGQPFASGRAVYTIAIFGQPSETTPWMIQFGGHHLGLNIVIAGPHGVMTPTLTGAQPASYIDHGKPVRALATESDSAFALLDALDAGQRKQAILNYAVDDLVAGPGHSGETIIPEGLKASAMNARQKGLLLTVIAQWAGIVDDAYARRRMAEIAAGLDDTWFAWSGPTTHAPGRNGAAYYRIQGPKLLIEFAPQGVGGDKTMHIHTVYRDPTDDYGIAYTRH